MSADIHVRINNLRREIREYDNAYYKDESIVSDEIYDAKLKELRTLEKKSGIQTVTKVGYSQQTLLSHPHRKPMYSLAAATTEEERDAFLERIFNQVEVKSFCLEPKYDGLATSLTYIGGQLTHIATRGDGIIGEDVSRHIGAIQYTPLKLEEPFNKGIVEIRGEIVMLLDDFERTNLNLLQKGLKEFATPRNAAAGTLRHLDTRVVSERKITFIPYGLGHCTSVEINAIHNQFQLINWFTTQGFYHVDNIKVVNTIEAIKDHFVYLENNRTGLNYDMDGMVVKVNHFYQQKLIGELGKDPLWASAFKYANKSTPATLFDIEWQVGRTGVVTPVAILTPIQLDGVTIRHATLHNATFMQNLSPKGILRIGDRVLIERAGGVIPKIVAYLGSTEDDGKYLKYPDKCPSCKSKLTFVNKDLVCKAGVYCGGQLESTLLNFASRDRMNIKGLGSSIIGQLVTSEIIKDISDLYRLTKESLVNKCHIGESTAAKLIRSIEESRHTTLARFLASLNIPRVGLVMAEKLAKHFIYFEKILEADIPKFTAIDGIDFVTAEGITEWFRTDINRKLLIKLMLKKEEGGCGLEWVEVDLSTNDKLPLKGTNYAFTGTLGSMARSEASGLLKALGANVLGGISKNVDILIAGEDSGSKLDSARALGIDIWDESQFLGLIKKYRD